MVLKYCLSLLLIVLCASVTTADTMPPLKPVEGRGIWIDANSIPTNDREMASFVESFARAHLNVLIPETMRRGYTIYPSKLDEQDPRFAGYDPLAAMVREAHKHGLEVHPWVWVFRQGYTNHEGPIFTKHPEWMAVNKWGETLSANGGYWVCPSISEARDYLLSVFKEIVAGYDIDGFHLDYIRYETQSPTPYCYNTSCREQFQARYGIDPMQINPLSRQQIDWHLWREDLVNSFVRQITDELHALKPELKISAAVGSTPDSARLGLLQNWPHWVDNKWIDFLTPMAYTSNLDTFRRMVAEEKAIVDDRTILMPGIGLHTLKSAEPMVEQIATARSLNGDGVTLFAAAYLDDAEKDVLATGPFFNMAEIPFRRPLDRVKTLLRAAVTNMRSNTAAATSYLNDAGRLLGYLAYQAEDVGYIEPVPPPILIPENVLPLPSVDVPRTAAPVIDGKLDDAIWSAAARISINYTQLGQPAPVQTQVLLAYDDTNLYIGCIAQEPMIDKLKQTVTKRDGPTFYDDSIEFFLDPWARRHEYYHLSANTLGTQFDGKVMNTGVNLNWTVEAGRSGKEWTIEIGVPFASLGVTAPKPGDTWYANFARNRWTTGTGEYLVWSVPYGGFHTPERFGTLVFR